MFIYTYHSLYIPSADSKSFLFQVLPRNEHEPSWVSNTTLNGILENVTVASNTERGTTIVTLAASDNDAGRDGTITYQLIAAISGVYSHLDFTRYL